MKRTPKQAGQLAMIERQAILEAMQAHDWNRTKAALWLGISLRTLRNKLKVYRSWGDDIPVNPVRYWGHK